MPEIEPFYVFRTTLFIALAAYYAVSISSAAWRVGVLLHGDDPRKRLLRLYFSYQLLSFRARPLSGELLQIAFWVTILVLLWWLHTHL
ncbi:MAG: hypothetical protein KAY37_10740 [Phycisphaerae bacterium]|nr:hypothetical protein [Phycisphaerae bacterium]